MSETHEFQAEVQRVLDIVINSLYTDKEIFVRELVSNASDALEKLRHTQITEKEIHDDNLSLEINITTDDKAGTLTIQDFGIGMTHDEIVENLGTIAHSGSKKFLEALKDGDTPRENLIGQFGVGFYSTFMAADKVKVYTHSWNPDEPGLAWESEGAGSYTIQESEGQRRGTKVVVHLKKDCKEFAGEDRIKQIIRQYSNFVQFPININGERVNTIEAIWLRNKSEITDEEYTEFYKFQSNAFDEPLLRMHFNTDAPISINALIFVPKENTERFGFGKMDPGVALHCRKVLIDPEAKGLLPDWIRFLKGVVDSADLPLNISRETMQDSALVQKLNSLLTKRFVKLLLDTAKKDPGTYETFWDQFGIFIKEGVHLDYSNREKLGGLLRYESSYTEAGKLTSLADYVSRMPEDQEHIYYLFGQNRASIEAGPFLEAFKARNIEVLYTFEEADEIILRDVGTFEEKKLLSGDSDEVKLEKLDDKPTGDSLDDDASKVLCEWLSDKLDKKVSSVEASDRLIGSPACILNADKSMTANMRRIMQAMNKEGEEAMPTIPPVKFQINPRHKLILNLDGLRTSNEELATLVAEQIFDNALATGDLLDDPREMVNRSYQILEVVSGS
uniref:Chaperone protein HtpG n=1 Tax=uncultured verrucomicrobium HF0500_27H16 TaxID=723600 RepID=E7C5K6_9BACT|nr:molecular chaperone, HSP90 family [uncultured verrucomicrobium HF0500_27H16]